MPYRFERTRQKLPPDKDRRRKLTDEQREEIRSLHRQGWSQRKLARAFGVSRRLISFLVDPAKHQVNLQARAERGGWRHYYDKDKHREAMRNHRRYKQAVLNGNPP